jgi:Flp pilus assembly protein TadD
MFSVRHILVAAALVLPTILAPRAGLAQEPYGKYEKPPTPITGEPAWRYRSDPRVDAAKIRAVRLYVEATNAVELARSELQAAEVAQAKAGDDVKAQRGATRRVDMATRRFAIARDNLRQATELDATCADCWNLYGYTLGVTGDREGAFKAFARCLAINPNHFSAHAYQGESYLRDGRIRDARAELEWLKAKGNMTTLETRNLTAAIERWAVANPEAAKNAEAVPAVTSGETTAAPADSTSK